MRINVLPLPQPPPEFEMRFSRDEGWAIVAALKEWCWHHRAAANVSEWREWADELDAKLRRSVSR